MPFAGERCSIASLRPTCKQTSFASPGGSSSVTTGTLNPGNNADANGSATNVGRLITGALTLSSTATTVFDLAGGTTYDQLFANGNITLRRHLRTV